MRPPSTLEQQQQYYWAKVEVVSNGYGSMIACWPWRGCLTRSGYGRFKYNGKVQWAHRVGWQIVNGPIPDGLHVLHRCDHPWCENPSHWFLGTHNDNMQDKMQKGRHRYGARYGVDNHSTKLTVVDVQAIRASTKWPRRELAKLFGVTPEAIDAIRKRKTWKWVD